MGVDNVIRSNLLCQAVGGHGRLGWFWLFRRGDSCQKSIGM